MFIMAEKHAVKDLTIEVRPGIIYGLLGPNGAGKTSTLSAIEGLLNTSIGLHSGWRI